MKKSSDWFREYVGDRTLMFNPAARAVYETLKGYEDHHAEEHKDCEDAAYERLRVAMAGLREKPLALVGGPDTSAYPSLSKPEEER